MVFIASFGVDASPAADQPTAAMMQPVRQLAIFMSTLPPGGHAAVFAAHDVCIVENFAPFVFRGRNAAAEWEAGFRAHAGGLTQLSATFDAAQDFSVAGDRVYFSLPTTWTGLDGGRHFEEHGAWAFVLERTHATDDGSPWRILSYGWGVTAYTESP